MENRILKDAQIMIVDDQELNVRLLEAILDAANYTHIVSTTDPHQVCSLTTASQPDLILLDLMMPEMDGFQVMKQLKSLIPEQDYLPILVLTADVTAETKRRALATGATDFLTKPFDRIEVLLRIDNLLRTRFLHLETQSQNRFLEKKVQERTEEVTRMLHQVMAAQETERRRLSMEIHDGPLQSLGVCILALDRLIRTHERSEHRSDLSGLHDLRTSLSSTVDEVRGVLAGLSLEVLTSYGLVPALRDYVGRLANVTDIEVHLSLDEEATSNLAPQLQLLIYRLAQEVLANVRKHAWAHSVELSLQVEGDALYLTIADDGRGFDVETALQEHYAGEQIGLRSMQERIRNAQGDMSIDSAPGKGTVVRFWCPLNTNSTGGADEETRKPSASEPPNSETAEAILMKTKG